MHKLIAYLSKLRIIDSRGQEIPIDSPLYKNFMVFLNQFCSSRNKTLLYRGCNPSNIFRSNLFDIKGFSEKIYMLGEKSHHFESKDHPLICIDDCSNDVFKFIFDRFHDKVCTLDFSNSNSRKKVKLFLESNPLINNYFSDINNLESFLSTISQMDDSNKRHVLDYYFSLLHTIGKSADGSSYFISTSKNIEIAKQFKNDGIIVITWVPSSERNRQIICYNDINKLDSFIKTTGLPYYETSLYGDQEEVCVKGGILPHYIVGYVYQDSFIVNPNLLAQISTSYDFESLLKDGIYTDQINFDNESHKTKYKRGFLCINGYYYEY